MDNKESIKNESEQENKSAWDEPGVKTLVIIVAIFCLAGLGVSVGRLIGPYLL